MQSTVNLIIIQAMAEKVGLQAIASVCRRMIDSRLINNADLTMRTNYPTIWGKNLERIGK